MRIALAIGLAALFLVFGCLTLSVSAQGPATTPAELRLLLNIPAVGKTTTKTFVLDMDGDGVRETKWFLESHGEKVSRKDAAKGVRARLWTNLYMFGGTPSISGYLTISGADRAGEEIMSYKAVHYLVNIGFERRLLRAGSNCEDVFANTYFSTSMGFSANDCLLIDVSSRLEGGVTDLWDRDRVKFTSSLRHAVLQDSRDIVFALTILSAFYETNESVVRFKRVTSGSLSGEVVFPQDGEVAALIRRKR